VTKAGPRLSKGFSTKLFGRVGYSVLYKAGTEAQLQPHSMDDVS
jgi:hypothetical protein